MIGVFHDRSKVNDSSLEEMKSAISHTKESKSSINTSSVLNPVKVLSLFKRMTDVVNRRPSFFSLHLSHVGASILNKLINR